MQKIIFFSFALAFSTILACRDSDNGNKQPRLQLKEADIAPDDLSRNPYAAIDVSPMDMSYYPVDYTKLKMTGALREAPVARVIYSRPHLQGRTLFHGLLTYDQPWRLGANESTEIQLFRNINIQDKKVNEGRYILYCIPHEKSWTIIFNRNIDTWGLKPDTSQDVYRFEMPAKTTDNHLEYFTMVFEQAGAGANLVMAWDDVETRLHFTFQ